MRELFEAAFVVNDDDSAKALTDAGFAATCSTRIAEVLMDVARATVQGMPVVIVDPAEGALREYLVGQLPTVRILSVPLPPGAGSVAGLLGYRRGESWDLQSAIAKQATWLAHVQEQMRTVHAPADNGPARFPVTALPRVLRDMVEQGAAAQGVDVAFWAVPLLGIVSGCIGATRLVRLSSGWLEPALLWTAVIAPSGAGKSPPLRALLQPVRDYDYTLHLSTVAAQRRHEVDTRNPSNGQRPPQPPMLAALVDDVTLEALMVRNADNPRGLLLAVDELAGWVRSFDRYRHGGGDAQQWLQIHGAAAVKIDRKGSSAGSPSRIYVRRAAVAVTGTIQPGIARRYLGGEEAVSSGLTARLLLAMPPVLPAMWSDASVPPQVHEAYGRILRSLLDLSYNDDAPKSLGISDEARAEFIRYHDGNGQACAEAAQAGEEPLAAALSKLRGAAPRIALGLALVRAAENGCAELIDVVEADDMRAGIEIASWFEQEVRRIYREWSIAEASDRVDRERGTLPALADRIVLLLEGGPMSRTALRDALGRNVRSARIGAALEMLRAAGRADCDITPPGPRGGQPRETWRLTRERASA